MNDADAMDMLIQMRGELRWNHLMREWVSSIAEIGIKHVFAHGDDPIAVVRDAHAQWLIYMRKREQETAEIVLTTVGERT